MVKTEHEIDKYDESLRNVFVGYLNTVIRKRTQSQVSIFVVSRTIEEISLAPNDGWRGSSCLLDTRTQPILFWPQEVPGAQQLLSQNETLAHPPTPFVLNRWIQINNSVTDQQRYTWIKDRRSLWFTPVDSDLTFV